MQSRRHQRRARPAAPIRPGALRPEDRLAVPGPRRADGEAAHARATLDRSASAPRDLARARARAGADHGGLSRALRTAAMKILPRLIRHRDAPAYLGKIG